MSNQRLPSRREVLGGATTAALAAGGLLYAMPGGTRAEITANELTIPADEYESQDGDPYSPVFEVSGEFSYQTPDSVASWRVELQISKPTVNTWETLNVVSQDTSATQLTETYTLRGTVVSSSLWDSSDFAAPDGESVTVTVPVRVFLMVATPDNMQAAQAQATTDVKLTVTDTGVEQTSAIQGDGTVSWQETASS